MLVHQVKSWLLLLILLPLAACVTTAGPVEETIPSQSVATQSMLLGKMREVKATEAGRVTVYESGSTAASRGLVIVHGWWGLTDAVKEEADFYARQLDAHVVAVDLFSGVTTVKPKKAHRLVEDLNISKAFDKVGSALSYLAETTDKQAVLGWGLGGKFALQAAIHHPDKVDAVVVYYGELERQSFFLKLIDAPILGLFSTVDAVVTPEHVREFGAQLRIVGHRDHSLLSFNAAPGFAEAQTEQFHPGLADEAHRLSVNFLAQFLAPTVKLSPQATLRSSGD